MKDCAPGKTPRAAGMLGACLNGDGDGDLCEFRVWAPNASRLIVRLLSREEARDLPMHRHGEEHFILQTAARAGDRYFYRVDENKPVPDPVSRLLPEGVHGPTQIVNPEQFQWTDEDWRGLPLKDYVIYEIHVGAFTPQGTLDAAIEKLPCLKQLGVTVVEVMPVAAFPGTRNWGYDGVSPYAVQASYGGPEALRRFVDAAHSVGLGVVLDVVYNHLGNEGNYLRLFGPYFTSLHKTPWGDAINYDQECCQGVRDYVTENAKYWISEYHIDGLRLDAVQTLIDDSPVHILAEIGEKVDELGSTLGREVCVIAETDQNDAKIVRTRERGGYGLSGLWSDDFHHAVQAYFTGERYGYYRDFGRPEQIVRALNEGFVYQGEPFQFWQGRPRGSPANDVPPKAHVICMQNHDQVGNRPGGERWTAQFTRGARILSIALLLLSTHTPLLFMGQEYDEVNPFLFFTDYGDPELRDAVRQGRRNEFKDFGHAAAAVPDPEDPAIFERSRLNWRLAEANKDVIAWYRALLDLRKRYVINSDRTCKAELVEGVIYMQVPAQDPVLKVLARIQGTASLPALESGWRKAMEAEQDGFALRVVVKNGA